MGMVLLDMSMSLDGIIAAPDDYRLHEWYFRSQAGSSSARIIDDLIKTTGAILMGRRTYDLGDQMDGFVDDDFGVPHFVLTHTVPEQPAKGGTLFTFVTDGVQSALAQAKAAAGGLNVVVMGGADLAGQCLKAGIVDEIQIHLVPVLLGEGVRLFDHLDGQKFELQRTRVIESSGATHLRFRVLKEVIP